MKMRVSKFFTSLCCCLAIWGTHGMGHASESSGKPLNIIVPFAPGTGPDTITREVAETLKTQTGRPVVVVNRPGANGSIAVQEFKRASADGNSLIILDSSILTINPHLYPSVRYATEDVAPLASLASVNFDLIVSKSLGVSSLDGFVDYARKNPGKISYGILNIGNPGHLGMLEFLDRLSLKMESVPYQSAVQAMLVDLSEGRIQATMASFATARPFVEQGRVQVLAGGGNGRSRGGNQVPVLGETPGLSNFTVTTWLAIYGPPTLPPAKKAELTNQLAAAMGSSKVADRLTAIGYERLEMSPEKLQTMLQADSLKYGSLIEKLRISVK